MNLTINMDNEIGIGAKYLFEHLEYCYGKNSFCHILMKFSYMKNNWSIRLKTSPWTLNMTMVPPTQAVLSGHKGNTTFWSSDHLFHLENLCVNKLESKSEDERDIRSEFTRNVRRIHGGEDGQIRLQTTWISNLVKERVTSANTYILCHHGVFPL